VWGRIQRRAGLGWLKLSVSQFSLERGTFILSGFAKMASMTSPGRNFFPVHVIRMELNLYCLPDDAFTVSSFRTPGSWP